MGLFNKSSKNGSDSKDNAPRYPMTIGGHSVSAKEWDAVINPYDLSTVGYAPKATAKHLDDAVRAAQSAFKEWSRRSSEDRANACLQVAKIFEENAPMLSELITKEQGKPLDAGGFGSGFEVGGCIGWSQATSAINLEDKVIVEGDGVTAIEKHVPIGVIGSITPWNWPLLIAVWHFIPAIRAGNTVVVKPSENTPLSTLKAIELLNEVLPAGVLNVVAGAGEIGAAMSSHAGIDKIVFTGSTATGKRVMASASENVTRCTLELGGNDPAIVLPGAPVEAMAPGLFFGSFINAGQTCGAIKRIYVHENEYDQTCDILADIASKTTVGDGLQAATDMGPIQNKDQYEKVRRLTREAQADGAELLVGGEQVGDGYCLTPAILKNCRNGMSIVDEEQFGPVVPVIKYSSVEDAVEFANDSEFGLCASVWGTDGEALQSVSDQLVAGTVYVNTHAELNPMVPFGGVKSSGIGVQFGEAGLKGVTETKVVYERRPN